MKLDPADRALLERWIVLQEKRVAFEQQKDAKYMAAIEALISKGLEIIAGARC